jgi:hypothetical protein
VTTDDRYYCGSCLHLLDVDDYRHEPGEAVGAARHLSEAGDLEQRIRRFRGY